MADHLHKIAAEVVRLYHKQLSLLVLCNIAGLKVADVIDYDRGKKRIQQLRRELEAMVQAGKGATVYAERSSPQPGTPKKKLWNFLEAK